MRPDSIVFVGLVLLATACTPPPPRRACVPGSSQTCSALGCIGTQTCSASGDGFGTCMCSGSGAGQAGVGGGSSVGGGSAAGGSAAGGSAGGGSTAGGSAAGGSAGGAACSVSCNGCCSGTQCVAAPNNANNGTCGIGGALCANCAAIGALCDGTLFICTVPMAGGSAAGGSAAGGSAAGGSAAGGSAAGGSAAGGSAAGGSPAGGSAAGGSAAGGSAAGGSAAGGSAAGGSAAGGSPAGGSAAGGSAAGGSAAGGSAAGGSAGGSGGGAAPCDGCRLANGTCQPRGTSSQNNNICGSGGQTCQACLSPTPLCDNGTCVAPALRVGDACVLDAQCQASLGSFARCRLTNLSSTITYTAGHCTLAPCGTTGIDDCPLGSVCLNFPRIYGEEQAMCFVSGCGTAAPCRSGYSCFNVGSSTTTCLPSAFNDVNLSLDTTSVVGNACTLNSNCRAPTPGAPSAGGLCLAELLTRADGGLVLDAGVPQPTGNPGGYCSRTCRIDEDCTATGDEDFAEGICLSVSQTVNICYRGCASPRGGQSNCRPGYVCERLLTNDGGVLGTGFCSGRCDVAGGNCGNYSDGGTRPCLSTGYCLF